MYICICILYSETSLEFHTFAFKYLAISNILLIENLVHFLIFFHSLDHSFYYNTIEHLNHSNLTPRLLCEIRHSSNTPAGGSKSP